jgi:hypothetical protein
MVDSWKIKSLVALQWWLGYGQQLHSTGGGPGSEQQVKVAEGVGEKSEGHVRSLSMWSLSSEKSERERGKEGFQTSGGRRRETRRS